MRRSAFAILLVLCALTILPLRATAQDNPPAAAASAVTGARSEFLAEVVYYEQRYTRLAEAVPAEKYSWRPGEGVRSIGEVYAHIATANYGIARALGTPLPAGVDPKTINAAAGDKAKTIQTLKDSFAHFRVAILAIKDADLNNAQKMFGQDTTVRGAFFLVTGHFGEHLGQSIAYARQNGIVPPWTEERMKQEAAKPKP
jgi:uncharacterized damage-inducible protein DinB